MTLYDAMMICYDTTNFDEYIKAYTVLNSIAKMNARVIKACIRKDDSIRFVDCIEEYEPMHLPAGTILRHYSSIGDISELKSSFRSIDDCLYDSNRIYFWIDDTDNSDRKFDHCYEYICDGTEVIYPDPEFADIYARTGKFPAGYMKADHDFRVSVTERR